MNKKCSCCQKTQPLERFHKNKGHSFGVYCYCKECTKTIRKKYRPRYKEWRKEYNRQHQNNKNFGGQKQVVLERDNYRCVSCGITQEEHIKKHGFDLNVHHKDGKGRRSPTQNNNLDNLETLCHSCHSKKHKNQPKGDD